MKNAIIWGDVATWVTGIATIALFIIGFFQIKNERDARLKAEVDAKFYTKRKQAEKISCWIAKETKDGIWVAVLNQSSQPVYQVIISIVVIGPMGGETIFSGFESKGLIPIAPPGTGYLLLQARYQGMHRRAGVEIAFMDVTGINWIRKAEGELLELDKSSLEYYTIPLPVSWSNLLSEITEN